MTSLKKAVDGNTCSQIAQIPIDIHRFRPTHTEQSQKLRFPDPQVVYLEVWFDYKQRGQAPYLQTSPSCDQGKRSIP